MDLDEYITFQEEKLCREKESAPPPESLLFHNGLGRVATSMFQTTYDLQKPGPAFTPREMLPFLP